MVDNTRLLADTDGLSQGFTIALNEAALVVCEGPHKGERLVLEQEQLHIGRGIWCDLCLECDEWISTEHTLVTIDNGRVRLQDLGSTNGMFLNGHQVRDVYLRVGGQIKLGNTVLELQSAEQAMAIEVSYHDPSGLMLGRSKAMRRLFAMLPRVAPRLDISILLQGETGTGKSLMAESIHAQSGLTGPLVTVDCTTLQPDLMGAELFGHEKGAFTGADRARDGLIAAADGGTLFLDEIGEIPLDMQRQLLRVIETKKYRRVGAKQERSASFRTICATHRTLPDEVAAGRFREDLYYRIATVNLRLPPLRERREDLPLLCRALLSTLEGEQYQLGKDAISALERHLWPGNIRELRNVLTKATLFAEGGVIDRFALEEPTFWSGVDEPVEKGPNNHADVVSGASLSPGDGASLDIALRNGDGCRPLKQILQETTQEVLRHALAQVDGNVEQAAKLLGISRGWCFTLVRRHGLKELANLETSSQS